MKDATKVAKIQYAVLFIPVLEGLVKDRLMVLTAPAIRVIRKVMVIIFEAAFRFNNHMFEQYNSFPLRF